MCFRIKEHSKLHSAIYLKCPRCQQGNLFEESNPFKLDRAMDMPKNCPICNQDFVKEPGFYDGAIWLSYLIEFVFFNFHRSISRFLI